jgi:DNA invertase Pin-like site-specific DNA recombinase
MPDKKCYSYIRFSSKPQERGDSIRRQTELAERYAKEHGLILDQSTSMLDAGLSAYKGQHTTKGALGAFLKLIEGGKIPKGSILLVESLDRLSREQVLDALSQFTAIIGAGVQVVTLSDQMEYDRASINANFGQLMMSIVIMSRAHEESERKSKMRRNQEDHRRAQLQAGNPVKLSRMAPWWLELSKDGTSYTVRPDRAVVIKKIYRLKLEGKSNLKIAQVLNQSKAVAPEAGQDGARKNSKGWGPTYIARLLSAREVLGEYQPKRTTTKEERERGADKKLIEGGPIINYYPPIIPQNLFDQVQQHIAGRRRLGGNAGGRTGKVHNLFTHIGRCGVCGGALGFVMKSKPLKAYLVCDSARRGRGCEKHYHRYDEVERLILTNLEELDVRALFGDQDHEAELDRIRGELATVQARAGVLDGQIDNLADSIATTISKDVRAKLEVRMDKDIKERVTLTTAAEDLGRQLSVATSAAVDAGRVQADLAELIEKMNQSRGAARIELRGRVREAIRGLVESIKVFPLTKPYCKAREFIEPEPEPEPMAAPKSARKSAAKELTAKEKARLDKMVARAKADGPELVEFMDSKTIDRIRIKYRGAKTTMVIFCRSIGEAR